MPLSQSKQVTKRQAEYRLLAFDPGGVTGFAYFRINIRAFTRPEHKVTRHLLSFEFGELEGSDHYTDAVRLLHRVRGWPDYDVTYCDALTEDFELTQIRGKSADLLSPVRFNAVMEWEWKKLGGTLRYQKRSERIPMTAERLDAYGFHRGTRGNRNLKWSSHGRGKDAFAAVQHGVQFLRKLKEHTKRSPLKLPSDGVANGRWDCACETGGRCDLRHTT